MKWSILIPSMPSRREWRRRVLMILEPQLEGYDDIELLILEDNCKRTYGEKLQSMVDIANGEYLCFIDDDDLVSEHYVEQIYPLLNGVDCVGFMGHVSINDGETLPVFYSIDNKVPVNKPDGYYRYIQHVNPIKSSIVRQVPYEGHFGADTQWASKVLEKKLVNTQNYIKHPMYMYLASTTNDRGVWEK